MKLGEMIKRIRLEVMNFGAGTEVGEVKAQDSGIVNEERRGETYSDVYVGNDFRLGITETWTGERRKGAINIGDRVRFGRRAGWMKINH